MPHLTTDDGVRLYYEETGSATPIVFVHEFADDYRGYEPQIRYFARRYRCIAYNARGYPPSDVPEKPTSYSQNRAADDIASVMDHLKIDKAHIVGLSWGGLVAQAFVGRYPSRVRSLVLSDTYAGWKGSLPADAVEKRLARCLAESELAPAELVERWVPMEFFTEDVSDEVTSAMADIVSGFHPLGFRLMARSLAENDTMSLLSTIRVPTLLLWGESDQRSPLEVAERFRDAIPDAELAVIPAAGHVSNMEQPDLFTSHVRRFLWSSLSA